MVKTRGKADTTSTLCSEKSEFKHGVPPSAAKRSAAKDASTTALTLHRKQTPKAISKKTPLSTTSGSTTESQAKPANWRDLQASTTARSGLSSDPKNDPVERIVRRGPHGSPVRDHLGYELDYDKVMKARRGLGRKKKMYGPKHENIIDDGRIEEEKKRMIMGTSKGEVSATTLSAWQDRVSRDLGVPYHMIEMGHFEEWRRKGFKADPVEFEAKNISEADDIRIWNLTLGSAFRVRSTEMD